MGAEQRLDVLPAGRFRSEKRKILRRRRAEPVDCIKRRVPEPRRRRELLSVKKRKRSFDDKNKENQRASSGSARLVYNDARRRSETVTRGHREPEVFRIMKDARLSGSNVHST